MQQVKQTGLKGGPLYFLFRAPVPGLQKLAIDCASADPNLANAAVKGSLLSSQKVGAAETANLKLQLQRMYVYMYNIIYYYILLNYIILY